MKKALGPLALAAVLVALSAGIALGQAGGAVDPTTGALVDPLTLQAVAASPSSSASPSSGR